MTRRQFFQWTGAGMLGAAWQGTPLREWLDTGSLARVTRQQVNVYAETDMQSEVVGKKFRDEILHVYYPVTAESGVNRLWYRTWGGYVHSGHLQMVAVRTNAVDAPIPDGGCPGEVTVPFSQSTRYRQYQGWESIYRLYFGSVHWITDLVEGPDRSPWYRLVDSYQREYYAPADHFR
ncbi:MAG TPA: hypothetical protein VFF68_13290, partial [Anaerolineaceae bacterium]|nr:hypothetical protein [Anaerolineaceae bacterium]